MDHISPELLANLEHMGLTDLLTGFIAPERVRRWGFVAVERFALEHGYQFVREGNNVYGRLMLVPVFPQAAPAFRIITRSDHAAVYGRREKRAA